MPAEISQWITDLTSTIDQQRIQAARSLAELGPDAQPAAIPLVQAAGDPNEEVAEWVTATLEEIGPPEPQRAAELASVLGSYLLAPLAQQETCGYWAATLLGRLGQQGSAGVNVLIQALDQSTAVPLRQRAAWALGKIGSSAHVAIAALQETTHSDNARLARTAQRAIDQIQE